MRTVLGSMLTEVSVPILPTRAFISPSLAFGIFGRLLVSPKHESIIKSCEGLELADSITGDGHKLLNVPYDCGFFFSRHRDTASHVFQNTGAAYLKTPDSDDSIVSPLNIGLENSRRLRALPVYASLTAYGSAGYRAMLERQVTLARRIAEYIDQSDEFELLPNFNGTREEKLINIFIVVMFRAKDEALNNTLVDKIKADKRIYVSGTAWGGKPACRFAISNWMSNVEKDFPVIEEVLAQVSKSA